MFGQKEQQNANENRFKKKVPGSASKSIKRSSSIDNSSSAVAGTLNNSASVFCISLQGTAELTDDQSDDHSDDAGQAKKPTRTLEAAAGHSTNAQNSTRNSKHSARSRGKSTDRFHSGDLVAGHADSHNNTHNTMSDNQRNNVKQFRKPNENKRPPNRRPANHLTKRNSIDGPSKGINGRFIKIWIETLIGTAYEVGIMPDEPIFNLKLKLEIEENIPVLFQTLYYGEDELNDSFTIEEYEIENGATLKLQVQDKNSGKHRFADAQPTFAIDERTYNLLFDETADGQRKQAPNSASLTDSKSIDEFRMLNASSNLGCISVIGEHKPDESPDAKKDPHDKREKMELLLEKMQKWSKFNRQAIKLPNLSSGNREQNNRRAELGSSNSLNETSNLSIPNSLSSPNNLTILGAKQKAKEQANDGGEFQKSKRLSNQFEKKTLSVRKGFQFFPRFRSNSSFNLITDYESAKDPNGKKARNSESKDGCEDGCEDGEEQIDEKPNDKPENRPSSVPHLIERKPTITHKLGINRLFGQRGTPAVSKKVDPEKKNKKAKNDNDQNDEHLREASDRLKPLPRKLPLVEVASKKEKTKSQKCPKCKKKPCKCELISENGESKSEDTSFIDKLDQVRVHKKILPKI